MTEDQSFFSNLYIAPVDTKFYRDICEPGIAHLATIDIFHVGTQGPFYRPRRIIGSDADGAASRFQPFFAGSAPGRGFTTPAWVSAAPICCMRLMRSTAAAGGSTSRQAG